VIVKRVVSVFKAGGVAAVVSAIVRRLGTPRARCFPICRQIVSGATGMEIGGPSPIFARGGLLPLYPLVTRVDNCNFAPSTIWEGVIKEGNSFHWGKIPGRQFIAEGTVLHMIPSGRYDFVLSSHMLEHTANPLRALAEWGRLLRTGGGLVLVVPHRDGTFDHRRPITTMQHLIEDLETGMGEDDLTHLPEILELHDVSRDPGVSDAVKLRERAMHNAEIRSLHHHVFDTRLALAAVERAGLDILAVEPLRPYHIVVVARKPLDGAGVSPFPRRALRTALLSSPFVSDLQGA
jgi:SAM-dependent methyltransferase